MATETGNSAENSVDTDVKKEEKETINNSENETINNSENETINNSENKQENENENVDNKSTSSVSIAPKYELTDEIANTLKCSLCHLYLSVTPIYIISEDGTKYKCGRCSIKTHINTRALMYENLAKHMTFPCIYKDCSEKLVWKSVKDHEKNCEFRTTTCWALNCDEIFLLKDFASHFKEKHTKLYFTDSISVNNLHTCYGMCMVEKDGVCFIISHDYDHFKFGLNVCAFQPHNKQFELVLKSTGSNYSIKISEQTITKFDERVNCYKCLKGQCKSEYHVYSYYSKGILKHMSLKVEKDVIRRTFGSKDVIALINIIDEKPESDEVDLDDILHGKEMIIDEVNDEEENEVVPEQEEPDVLKEMMKCPQCKVTMIPPIHECIVGHTFCSECKSKHEKCPKCEGEIQNTRNFILEEIAANLKLSIQNEVSEPTGQPLDKEIVCPLSKCFERIPLGSISSHFQEHHINNFHFNKFAVTNIYTYYNVDVLVKNDKTYLVLFDFDDMNFGVSMCSLEKDTHNYEVQLTSMCGKYSIKAVGQRIILFNDKEHCFKCSAGSCKNSEHTFRTKRKEVFRRLTTKINRDCVRRMFSSSSMNYKITVVASKNTAQKDKILRQLLECPICKDYMTPPIPQCVGGHTLCAACKAKLEKCPTCEAKIEETRNYVLEDIAEKEELPCQYETENCTFRGGVKRIASHEAECPLKSKKACIETAKS